jgi:hypothetical protein
VVAEGTPEEVRQLAHRPALREYDRPGLGGQRVEEGRPCSQDRALKRAATAPPSQERHRDRQRPRAQPEEPERGHPARQVQRGHRRVGSGKSTLAFDILFNEGQRRYLESLNAYARSIVQPAGRPEVDAVYGIPPTVAIEQRLSRGGRKSTVGTTTEVWHFLRLLYVKLGVQHCVHDGAAVQPQTPERIAAQLLRDFRGQHIGLLAPLVVNRKGVYTELADWARRAATRTCAWTASFCRPPAFRASTASRSTPSSCRWPAWCDARERGELRALARRWSSARACCMCCRARRPGTAMPRPPTAGIGRCRCSPPSAPARSAPPAMPSWTRACSPTTASTAGAPTAWARASS